MRKKKLLFSNLLVFAGTLGLRGRNTGMETEGLAGLMSSVVVVVMTSDVIVVMVCFVIVVVLVSRRSAAWPDGW